MRCDVELLKKESAMARLDTAVRTYRRATVRRGARIPGTRLATQPLASRKQHEFRQDRLNRMRCLHLSRCSNHMMYRRSRIRPQGPGRAARPGVSCSRYHRRCVAQASALCRPLVGVGSAESRRLWHPGYAQPSPIPRKSPRRELQLLAGSLPNVTPPWSWGK